MRNVPSVPWNLWCLWKDELVLQSFPEQMP